MYMFMSALKVHTIVHFLQDCVTGSYNKLNEKLLAFTFHHPYYIVS